MDLSSFIMRISVLEWSHRRGKGIILLLHVRERRNPMEEAVVDDYLSITKCISFFEKENLTFVKTEIRKSGEQRIYFFEFQNIFEANTSSCVFIFSQRIRRLSVNIRIQNEEARIPMSRAAHEIINYLKEQQSTAFLRLLMEEKWLNIGHSIMPKYQMDKVVELSSDELKNVHMIKSITGAGFHSCKQKFIEQNKNVTKTIKVLFLNDNIYKSNLVIEFMIATYINKTKSS